MKSLFGRYWLALIMIVMGTTGCNYIKSLFPDKERDYQFRGEIPEMIVPDDLKPQAAINPRFSMAVANPSQPVIAAKPQPELQKTVKPAANATPTEPAKTVAKSVESNPIQVEVSNAAVSSIQIDQSIIQAWRLVGRALSKQQIEVVERNADNYFFFVKYDPEAKKAEDKTIWDEIDFLFGKDPSHEQKYRVSLLEISSQLTEVTVQNNDGQTISDLAATRLLKLITDGMNQETPATTQSEKSEK